ELHRTGAGHGDAHRAGATNDCGHGRRGGSDRMRHRLAAVDQLNRRGARDGTATGNLRREKNAMIPLQVFAPAATGRSLRSRRGFTLIEILLALALTLFILSILTQCFVAGADLFRALKAVGDMNASLRTTANILRSDLRADHFDGMRRLGDSKFWSTPNNGPPRLGYFYLEQG